MEIIKEIFELIKGGGCPDPNCDKQGTTFDVELVCCRHPTNAFECCGDPVPEQQPRPCEWCEKVAQIDKMFVDLYATRNVLKIELPEPKITADDVAKGFSKTLGHPSPLKTYEEVKAEMDAVKKKKKRLPFCSPCVCDNYSKRMLQIQKWGTNGKKVMAPHCANCGRMPPNGIKMGGMQ